MTVAQALLLGLVQGVTEFLPISSSGHLALAEAILGVNPGGVAFEVAVHLATLLAVFVYYARRIGGLAAGAARGDPAAWRFLGKLALGSVPAAAAGILLYDVVSGLFDEPALVAGLLAVTGVVLWTSRRVPNPGGAEISWASALWVGVAQAVALLPGISRSGMTVVAGLWRGLSPVKAAEFSFLLAVPAILGASILELSRLRTVTDLTGATVSGTALAVAFVAAALSGWAALVWLVRWLERGRLHRFALYCWAIAALFLIAWSLR